MAAHRLVGKESLSVAHNGHIGTLVDRPTDRWRQKRVCVCLNRPVTIFLTTLAPSALANNSERLPRPGTIIAASLTSPIDVLYLAAIFDPVFTASYPSMRLVQPKSLFSALLNAFSQPLHVPSKDAKLTDLPSLLKSNPQRAIVVFPECTTTNGRGILPFSPSLLTSPPKTEIFPVSLRYTPADVTTPIPGSILSFLWSFLSKPTHCIRIRIAQSQHNVGASKLATQSTGYSTNLVEGLQDDLASSSDTLLGSEDGESMIAAERRVLDRIGDDLARLGRVKRVGLGVRQKQEFVRAWSRSRMH